MTTSDDDSLNRLKETKTEYGSVSGVTTTCSLKQTTAYNDSQTESGSGQYASGLVKTLTVRDGKKSDSQPALSVYTLEYDAEGNAVKVTHGKPHKNALGDIDAIYDTDMNLVGEYIYDAWGNCTIETTGTDNLAIMQLNPFRYRGYYWDKELNLYYLQTRYYDPETGRFINADNIGYALEYYEVLNNLNLYSYCINNPVKNYDPAGNLFLLLLGAVAVGALIGTAIYVAVETKKNSTKIENVKYFDSAQEAADWWGQQLENQFISDNKFAGVEYGAHIYRKKVNGRFVYYIDRTYLVMKIV